MNPCNLCLQPHAPSAAEPDAALFSGRCVLVNGPVIVGAGPSGLAVAAGLQRQGVPFVIIEQAHCIASLWQDRTYDRLNLHLPKKFCHLPYVPFPAHFPQYPSKHHFVRYLESYAETFGIRPNFNEMVESAEHDEAWGLWRVTTVGVGPGSSRGEYLCRWLVAATGENAEGVVPDFEGMADFGGSLIHSCDYKSGEEYREKRVLVVGCGNSGMEVALDLCQHKATPYMVVRSSVHVLPREILGKSTFEIGVGLVKWMPIWAVDKILVMAARMVLGDLGKYGVKRPGLGPLQLKEKQGKTPVLDTGTLCKIKSGHIKIVPGIKKFVQGAVEMVDGQILEVDAVILATGYTSNVANWLKDSELFSSNGLPKGWKDKNGVYAVGFTRRGLSGASLDAVKVARDIGQIWKTETLRQKNTFAGFWCRGRCNRNSPQP